MHLAIRRSEGTSNENSSRRDRRLINFTANSINLEYMALRLNHTTSRLTMETGNSILGLVLPTTLNGPGGGPKIDRHPLRGRAGSGIGPGSGRGDLYRGDGVAGAFSGTAMTSSGDLPQPGQTLFTNPAQVHKPHAACKAGVLTRALDNFIAVGNQSAGRKCLHRFSPCLVILHHTYALARS